MEIDDQTYNALAAEIIAAARECCRAPDTTASVFWSSHGMSSAHVTTRGEHAAVYRFDQSEERMREALEWMRTQARMAAGEA